MPVMSEARARAIRSSIRNLLYPMTLREMQRELDNSIWMNDTYRTKCVNEYIQECIEEEGVCVICGAWAEGEGDMCCDCNPNF